MKAKPPDQNSLWLQRWEALRDELYALHAQAGITEELQRHAHSESSHALRSVVFRLPNIDDRIAIIRKTRDVEIEEDRRADSLIADASTDLAEAKGKAGVVPWFVPSVLTCAGVTLG